MPELVSWLSACAGNQSPMLIVRVYARSSPGCMPSLNSLQGRDAEAQGLLMQCIDVTADMAHELIVQLRWGVARPGGVGSCWVPG